MTPIAEFYFHLKPFSSKPETLKAVGQMSTELAVQTARQLYRIPVEVEVRVDHGSLKGWMTWAVVGSLYYGISSYPDFCEGTQLLVSHAVGAGDYVSRQLFETMEVERDVIFRTERRTSVPGTILRSIVQLERAETDKERLSAVLRLQTAMQPLTLGDRRTIETLVQEAYPRVSFGHGFEQIVTANETYPLLMDAPYFGQDQTGAALTPPGFQMGPLSIEHQPSYPLTLSEWLAQLKAR